MEATETSHKISSPSRSMISTTPAACPAVPAVVCCQSSAALVTDSTTNGGNSSPQSILHTRLAAATFHVLSGRLYCYWCTPGSSSRVLQLQMSPEGYADASPIFHDTYSSARALLGFNPLCVAHRGCLESRGSVRSPRYGEWYFQLFA